MAYARVENNIVVEYPVFEGDIKLRFPNVSFSIPFVAPTGYEEVIDSVQPSVDYTKVVTEGTPQYINGVLTKTWIVSDASPELIAERTQAKESEVRNQRNAYLMLCDWTQLPDAPVDHAPWATYRQALRDVTNQPGFPWNVVWPTPPA